MGKGMPESVDICSPSGTSAVSNMKSCILRRRYMPRCDRERHPEAHAKSLSAFQADDIRHPERCPRFVRTSRGMVLSLAASAVRLPKGSPWEWEAFAILLGMTDTCESATLFV
jgi:hypothetical protein